MRVLPARLARLTRDFAIILVRESFFFATAGVAATGTAAIAATITAAATTLSAAAPAATARAARSAAGFRFRASFVYLQIAATDVFAVESCNGFGCFGVIGHFDETETARASGLAIGGDVDAGELAEGLEERAEIVRGGLKAHIANKEILHVESPEQATTVASANNQRKPEPEAAFVQRKENRLRRAGTPNTLQEARKDCKTRRADDSF
jgi:hypothetical protein